MQGAAGRGHWLPETAAEWDADKGRDSVAKADVHMAPQRPFPSMGSGLWPISDLVALE